MNVWRNTGRWVVAAVLLGSAPAPLIAGRLMLSDRGATPVTATMVALGVAATILCLLGSVTALQATPRPFRQRRPARHTVDRGMSRAGRSRQRINARRWPTGSDI